MFHCLLNDRVMSLPHRWQFEILVVLMQGKEPSSQQFFFLGDGIRLSPISVGQRLHGC
jgi:hypothetical protein